MQEKRKNKPHCSLSFLPALAAFRDSNLLDLICCLLLSWFLSDSTYLSLTSENKGKNCLSSVLFLRSKCKRLHITLSFPAMSGPVSPLNIEESTEYNRAHTSTAFRSMHNLCREHIKFIMIFQSGQGVKTVKEISLFLNIGLTTAKKSPKISVIIIKTL